MNSINSTNMTHRNSATSIIISPKDLISLELPAAARIHSPSSLSSPRLSPRINSHHHKSWSPVDDLNLKFIDSSSSQLTRSNSLRLPSSSNRRNSINIKLINRKSIKLTTTPSPELSLSLHPIPISSEQLLHKINATKQPILIIDLRTVNSYLGPNGRIKGSINVNFPSLLMKRFRKGTPSNFQLAPFITTEAGKRYYSKLEKTYQSTTTTTTTTTSSSSSSVLTQLDICVIDDQLVEELVDEQQPTHHLTHTHTNSLGKIFLDVLSNLFTQRQRTSGLFFLNEKFDSFIKKPAAHHILLHGDPLRTSQEGICPLHPSPSPNSRLKQHPMNLSTTATTVAATTTTTTTTTTRPSSGPQGLLRLRPTVPAKSLPSIDQDNLPSEPSPGPPAAACGPIITETKIKPPKLRRIDTSESLLGAPRSAASLALSSKTSLAQLKIDHLTLNGSPKSSTLSSSISHANQDPRDQSTTTTTTTTTTTITSHESSSRQHVKFTDREQAPPTTDYSAAPAGLSGETNSQSVRSPCSPNTDPDIHFKVSTIIPSFLYLGPEPSKPTDFEELHRLGVRRILNTALECVDEEQLIQTDYPFITKYFQIPLRDFVEETGIQNGIQQANRILNDAFLHSAPTYVHCKAGKSRSVTIVLAYLIHRYRWSLKKSYAHVSERRQGICPNIGFLAELMNFEQRELGSKSHSILGPSGGHVKNARSVSHYGLGMMGGFPGGVPHPSATSGAAGRTEAGEEAGAGPGGLAGYSFDGRRPPGGPHRPHHQHQHPFKANSIDLTRHHGYRVHSLAVAAKNDFFPPSPALDDNTAADNRDRDALGNPPIPTASPESTMDSFRKGPRDSLPASFFPSAQSAHTEPFSSTHLDP
ncbi:hypothetical protein PCANC_11213 [Puccinia coronata f. sp. avenae]|uniref:protein-tyrosine-phosphatase n=1 Tax=Puccinia coronata f. sp. avenae TaxID=200324 RepID=A0A2N5V8J6_9BASI|nr:hypothetical protein PCANC_11213 [Puccinia coronata f. sp. avenae]